MDSFPYEDNLSDNSSFEVFGDENKSYANVTGIDVLRLHESLKKRNNKKPPSCTINLTNLGHPQSASIVTDLRGELCKLKPFKIQSSSGCQSVLGEQDMNVLATTSQERDNRSRSAMTFSADPIDTTHCHDNPYSGMTSETTVNASAEKGQDHTMAMPLDGSCIAKRKDPVKAQKFQKLVERLVVQDAKDEDDTGADGSDAHFQQLDLDLAGSLNNGSHTSTYPDVANHHANSGVFHHKDSSVSECSNMGATPNPSHGGSEVTAGSSVSNYNINNGDFSADTVDDRGNWNFSNHDGAQMQSDKHKLNSFFNPNANNFHPAPNGFNPNAASFAPNSAIPMSDAAAQAVEQQKKHQLQLELQQQQQQQQAQAVSQLAHLAPQEHHAATINIGHNDWLNPHRHQQRRQPLSNIFPDTMPPHTAAPVPDVGQDLLNSLAAQHIAFLTQQNAIMAATISQQSSAASLGAHSTFAGISPFGLADPIIAPFSHQLPGPHIPPFGGVGSMNNGMHTVPRFPSPFPGPTFAGHHGQASQQQIQTPRHYYGAHPGGYAGALAPPPTVGMQQSMNNTQHPGYVPVQQRSLVSLAGAPPPSQVHALSLPLANQHLLRFDADGNLIDVPKPRDHSDPQLQMAYEAAIEWKKANLPGYAQSCRERQNNRIANKLQGGRQNQGTHRNVYA
ncbi:hypothetical protein PpBr36_08352 [Pyricularia pennisetigena]|uniref:hypothetical protein n=1 Tax=Pyricularia pennisetigena TaxID=1578925 RepID=UPI00114E4261|nr:hypothetical protein PpBr36_08352 [Pyricularia pennisetigena]TLS24512.1 hypothetical protein PpBr36_08352 [Pyricularia pennisetigena]